MNRNDLRRIARITGLSTASLVAAIAQAEGAPPRELIYPERPNLILPDNALTREDRGLLQKLAIIPGMGFVPAFGGGAAGMNVADVFATSLWSGNSSAQTITTGLNMSGQGGLTWIKCRSNAINNFLFDTARGATNYLQSDTTNSASSQSDTLTAFGSTGFSLGSDANGWVNYGGRTYVSWSFRKAPKFFDIVTFTTDVVGGFSGAHALGSSVGMAVFKARNTASEWAVHHRSLSDPVFRKLVLNTSASETTGAEWYFDSTTFTVYNLAGSTTYVAYLFAHDPDPTGIIQCGQVNNNATVTLGWQPQFLILKTYGPIGGWKMVDTVRGISSPGNDYVLEANSSNSEFEQGAVNLTSTGFTNVNANNDNFVYLAIRAAA